MSEAPRNAQEFVLSAGKVVCGRQNQVYSKASTAQSSIRAMLVTMAGKKLVNRMQEKGKYRKKGGASGILGMYPAGTGELGVIKSRDEFSEGREGDELWYKHVEENEFLL